MLKKKKVLFSHFKITLAVTYNVRKEVKIIYQLYQSEASTINLFFCQSLKLFLLIWGTVIYTVTHIVLSFVEYEWFSVISVHLNVYFNIFNNSLLYGC